MSAPSKNKANSAEVKTISLFMGLILENTPCSNLLQMRTNPVPSKYRHLIDVRLEFIKTNKCPEKGS
jgi:hypothetical protein